VDVFHWKDFEVNRGLIAFRIVVTFYLLYCILRLISNLS
jgi:hypothetical protein